MWIQISELSPHYIFRAGLLLSGCAQDASPTQNVTIWHSGNETQQSTHFLLRLGTARTNPTDSTFKFNSLCIIIIWHKLQSAFAQKWPLEMSFRGKLFILILLRTFQNMYLITFTWVKKLSEYFCFYWSFFTQIFRTKWIVCVYFCHLW